MSPWNLTTANGRGCISGPRTASLRVECPTKLDRGKVCRKGEARAGSMGIGFTAGDEDLLLEDTNLVSPEFGLTVQQMHVLGLTPEGMTKTPVVEAVRCFPRSSLQQCPSGRGGARVCGRNISQVFDISQSDLTAKAFYVGDEVSTTTRQAVRMAVDTKAPGQAPPDLPSLLLDGRICYIGMPLVPSVTELVISELLWLNYANPEKPVYLYINSTGTHRVDLFCFVPCRKEYYTTTVCIVKVPNPLTKRRLVLRPRPQPFWIQCPTSARIYTLWYAASSHALLVVLRVTNNVCIRMTFYVQVIGQAFGNAAMILASGKKGHRFALPHSRIMTCPPRLNRSFGSVRDVMIKANELEKSTEIYVDHLARYTGQDKATLRKDVGRNRYFTPEQAIEYGLIDSVVTPSSNVAMESKDYEAMLRASQARTNSSRGGGGPAPADA